MCVCVCCCCPCVRCAAQLVDSSLTPLRSTHSHPALCLTPTGHRRHQQTLTAALRLPPSSPRHGQRTHTADRQRCSEAASSTHADCTADPPLLCLSVCVWVCVRNFASAASRMHPTGSWQRCRCCPKWSARSRGQGWRSETDGWNTAVLMLHHSRCDSSASVCVQSSVRMKLICRQIINQLLGVGINVSQRGMVDGRRGS